MKLRPSLIKRASELIQEAGLICARAYCALEAKPPAQWNKGRAALYILRTAFGVDWAERIRIVYAGDDFTDEDAIKALKGNNHVSNPSILSPPPPLPLHFN